MLDQKSANRTIELASLADKRAIEATPLSEACAWRTTLDVLDHAAIAHGTKPAINFQLKGDPAAPVFTMTFADLAADAHRLANGLHAAGVRPGDTVALLLPNLPETAVALYAAEAIGAAAPINPLLEPDIIAGILRESEATTLITLAPFPKTDVAAKAAEAAAQAPKVVRIIEIDLLRYVAGPVKLIAPLLRPKRVGGHGAEVLRLKDVVRGQDHVALAFDREITPDSIGAYFHTGGTTGAPKLAQHSHRGMVVNPWMLSQLLFDSESKILCALPLFHVFASYVMMKVAVSSGATLIMMTPQGFRGDGVIDNFWKLVERHRVSFACVVPTAIAAIDQRPVDADVSSLRYMISGSAPLPTALFNRFEEKAGVKLLEGYGMTEATCVTSCNPPFGERKIGSVGIPLPYVDVRICAFDDQGQWLRDCETDQIGEICFKGPSVFPGYKEIEKNRSIFFDRDEAGAPWLRTGDLGRVDADGYIWITGRAKDLIIRGGHNIDPGLIEEALASHPEVAFVGAIGQPDAYAGELPCAYVELVEGATVTGEELKTFASGQLSERAARPAIVCVMSELPKTAVGKTFKPALRKEAIARVFQDALAAAGVRAAVEVEDDPALGMVAVVEPQAGEADDAAIGAALNGFARPWRLKG